MSSFSPFLTKVLEGHALDEAEAEGAFAQLMEGGVSPVETAAFLGAIRVRGESVAELTGAARVLRRKALAVEAPPGAIDTCGTGGDGLNSFNISTAAAIVIAACGVPVAKHGNRAASSKSGSADVLEALGVTLDVTPEVIDRSLADANIAFLLAPKHHAAMRHVAPVRRELGVRTIFNLLGPLANPAGAKRQLIGVAAEAWLEPLAEVAQRLGTEKSWFVHGADGLDELSITGETHVIEVTPDALRRFTVDPRDVGLETASLAELRGGTPEENAAALRGVLEGQAGAYRDITVLNAAAGLVLAGKERDLGDAVGVAEEALDSGRARETLSRWIAITRGEE